MKPQTHCRNGHLRSEHGYVTKQGVKRCRECQRTQARQNYITSGTGLRVFRTKAERSADAR